MLPYACKLLKIKKSDLIAEGFKDFKNMAVQVFVKILKPNMLNETKAWTMKELNSINQTIQNEQHSKNKIND